MDLLKFLYLLLFITLISLTRNIICDDNTNININNINNNLIKDINDDNDDDDNGPSHEWNDYHLEAIGQLMSSLLKRITIDELGIMHMKRFNNELINDDKDDITDDSVPNYGSIVNDMAIKIRTKLESISSYLNTLSSRVKELFQHHLRYGDVSSVRWCCDDTLAPIVSYDRNFKTDVTRAAACDTGSLTSGSFSPGTNLTDAFRKNLDDDPNIRWQYFISTFGVHTEFPAVYNGYTHSHCNNYNDLNEIHGPKPSLSSYSDVPPDDVLNRHRDIYLDTVLPEQKHVLIMIDRGSAPTINQLTIAKAVGKFILNSLSHTDRVGVISFDSDVHYPQTNLCLKDQLANGNYETKFHLSRFIDSIERTNDPTNHKLGLERAFQMLASNGREEKNSIEQKALIVYISRGLLFSLTDAKEVMELMSREMIDNSMTVVVNCYVLIDDSKPVMYETVFLKDLAEMNYKKYHVKAPENLNIKPGIMVTINSSDHLGFILSGIYSVLSQNHYTINSNEKNDSLLRYSLPYWDPISKDVQLSLSHSVHHRNQLIGVVGIDVSLSYLTQEVIYYSKPYKKSYSFIIERGTGTVIHHPLFGRPSQIQEQPLNTDILHLEQYSDFKRVKNEILIHNYGNATIIVSLNQNNSKFITYYWSSIEHSPYVLVIAVPRDDNGRRNISRDFIDGKRFHHKSNGNFVYHRLDLALASSQHPRLCRHLKQLATLETATLFLSGSSFQSPYAYLQQEETTQMIQRYMAFLNDNTKLIANFGLKPNVKDDVHLTSRILPIWNERLDSSQMSKFIVRKYVATSDIMMMYPGALIERNFEPSRREWYQLALKHSDRITLTGPYLDVGGAGFIVTLSYAISIESYNSPIVMAMDMTLGYYQKFLLEAMPICSDGQMSCFLMDDRGYLLAHPSLNEPSGRGPLEHQHITHKEPLVANDLLNHKQFVSKKVCNSFGDRTIQRYYTLNMSINGLISNMVHGEQCAKYQIVSLPETNAFVGIVNQTCDAVTAFCPCSMTDRLCLNCHRFEQTDCECPCECPLEMDICTGHLSAKEDDNPNCPPIIEHARTAPVDRSLIDSLHTCYEMKCHNKNNELDCLGVLGCEWCQLDSDGITRLSHSFCHYQKRCFGGILGAASPYSDEISDGLHSDDYPTFGSAPVGPVAGGIMACFIMMALSVYCYRYHSSRQTPHFITSLADPHLRHTHFNNDLEDDPHEDVVPPIMPPSNVLVLASFENAASVSPYRINPTYRRPGGDSDHGYSTMTPHEADSELAGPAFIEPLLISRDKQRIKLVNATQSETENEMVSSRDSSPMPPMTVLPKESIVPFTSVNSPLLTQVQVHMVDTNG